jgi:hypothetical protein
MTAAEVSAQSGEGFVTIVILGALFVGCVLLLLGLLK